MTLAEAIEVHLRAMRAKDCAPRSMEAFVEECARHLADWLDRPLASLSRNEVAVRHEELTERCGPYLANRVLQQFRAVYNTAARRFEELPATNPVVAVTFNRVRRRRDPIPWDRLAAWRRRVDGLANPVRRDLQLFLLFTGLRSLDARTVRWEHLDCARGTLHRPKPTCAPASRRSRRSCSTGWSGRGKGEPGIRPRGRDTTRLGGSGRRSARKEGPIRGATGRKAGSWA